MIKIINCVAFGIMLAVNFIAATSGINDYTTGQISALHPTLFTPEGITFSIWWVIYIGLVAFAIAQFSAREEYHKAVNGLFIATCILNASWLFAWHHQQFLLSVVIMIALLITLIVLYRRISNTAVRKSRVLTLKAPFSIYLGWISVATINNIAVYLNVIDLNSYPELMTILMVVISFFLGLLMIGFRHDIFFGLTICWVLAGMIMRFWQSSDHENLVITPAVGIILIIVYTLVKNPRYFGIHSE